MLKAVQAPEPRWLRLEDEIGWSARQREDVEALGRRVVRGGERRLRVRRWLRRSPTAATRPAFRWRHVVGLARVTASEYGRPAPGYAEARQLLGL